MSPRFLVNASGFLGDGDDDVYGGDASYAWVGEGADEDADWWEWACY